MRLAIAFSALAAAALAAAPQEPQTPPQAPAPAVQAPAAMGLKKDFDEHRSEIERRWAQLIAGRAPLDLAFVEAENAIRASKTATLADLTTLRKRQHAAMQSEIPVADLLKAAKALNEQMRDLTARTAALSGDIAKLEAEAAELRAWQPKMQAALEGRVRLNQEIDAVREELRRARERPAERSHPNAGDRPSR